MSNKPKYIPRYDLYAKTFKRAERDEYRAVPREQPKFKWSKHTTIMSAAFEKAGVTRENTNLG